MTLSLTPRGADLVENLAPRVMDFWNDLLSGFSHAEIDTMIKLLTRLMLVVEGDPRKNKLIMSDTPISKPVKAKKSS